MGSELVRNGLKSTLKRDREGSCVSRGSGTTPEYAMHCESVPVQNCYRSRLAELWLKAGNSLDIRNGC